MFSFLKLLFQLLRPSGGQNRPIFILNFMANEKLYPDSRNLIYCYHVAVFDVIYVTNKFQ